MTRSAHRARTAQHTGSWARTGFALLVSFRPASEDFRGAALGRSNAPDVRPRAAHYALVTLRARWTHTRARRRRRDRLEIYLPHYSSFPDGVQFRNRAFSTACLAAHNPMPTTGKMTRDTVPTFS